MSGDRKRELLRERAFIPAECAFSKKGKSGFGSDKTIG